MYASIFPIKDFTEYNSTEKENDKICAETRFNKSISLLKSDELISKINSMALKSVFNEASCESLKVPSEKILLLKRSIQNFMTPQNSSLLKCFENMDVITKMNKNPELLLMASQILEKYYSEIDSLPNSNNSFKFECSLSDTAPPIYGKFQSAGSESKIQFMVNKEGTIAENGCHSHSQIITHEFSHLAGLSEANVREIDTLCAPTIIEKLNTENCKAEISNQESNQKPEGTAKVLVLQEIINQNQKIDHEQQSVIQPAFQEAIQANDFKPIPNTDLNTIANSNTESPAFARSLETVYNITTENMNAITKPLNIALATTVGIATATSFSNNPTNTSNTHDTLKNKNSGNLGKRNVDMYSMAEVIYDKKNYSRQDATPFDENEFSNFPKQSKFEINAKQQMDDLNSSAPSKNTDELNLPTVKESSSKKLAPPSQDLTESISSPTNGTEQSVASGSLTQSLSAMDLINGQQYQTIHSSYNNKNFIKELKDKKISIQVGNKYIGISPEEAKSVFIDNGSMLKKKQNINE